MDLTAQAERALIGTILLDPDKLVEISEIVKPEDFATEPAQKAYTIALSQWRNKKHVDLISISSQDGTLPVYLSGAMSDGFAPAAKEQARTVSINAKERRLKEGCEAIANSKEKVESRIDDLLRLYQREMFIGRKDPSARAVVNRFSESVKSNKKRGTLGVPTGFGFLEEKLIQYVPGHTWVMGAYTSVGKTAMMVQKICNLVAMDNGPAVIVISTEMSEDQILSRILGNFTGIYSQRILAGRIYPGEEETVDKFTRLISESNLKIYDDVYEMGEIETVFRKADLQGGVDVGFIDYVQNCRVAGLSKAYDIGETLSKGVQKLAKDVKATIVCLSQVSNDVGRGNTSQLEFKGAGEWAAVADVGIFLQKKDYQLRYQIKKNRHGPLHSHLFHYMADYTSLQPIEEIKEK